MNRAPISRGARARMRSLLMAAGALFGTAVIALLFIVSFGSDARRAIALEPGPASTAPDEPVAPVPEKISRADARRLRREFLKAVDEERARLRSREAGARREGDAGRKRRKSEWLQRENAARRAFFAANPHGPERRDYVRAFNARRTEFFEALKREETEERRFFEKAWKDLEATQRARHDRIENSLRTGFRPDPAELHPPGV